MQEGQAMSEDTIFTECHFDGPAPGGSWSDVMRGPIVRNLYIRDAAYEPKDMAELRAELADCKARLHTAEEHARSTENSREYWMHAALGRETEGDERDAELHALGTELSDLKSRMHTMSQELVNARDKAAGAELERAGWQMSCEADRAVYKDDRKYIDELRAKVESLTRERDVFRDRLNEQIAVVEKENARLGAIPQMPKPTTPEDAIRIMRDWFRIYHAAESQVEDYISTDCDRFIKEIQELRAQVATLTRELAEYRDAEQRHKDTLDGHEEYEEDMK
jgi:chromosome segregation ATPase